MSAGANLCDAGSGECYDDSHHVDSELELEELRDAVVDVASPHDGFDDAGKIVVGQDDVGRLLGYVCASNTLETKGMMIKNLSATARNIFNFFLKSGEKLTMAKPTSAFFKAGPSLVPSPVTATTCLCSNTVLSIIPRKANHEYLK